LVKSSAEIKYHYSDNVKYSHYSFIISGSVLGG